MIYLHYLVIYDTILAALAFRNTLYTLSHGLTDDEFLGQCMKVTANHSRHASTPNKLIGTTIPSNYMVLKFKSHIDNDPFFNFEEDTHRALFGPSVDPDEIESLNKSGNIDDTKLSEKKHAILTQYPSGSFLRISLFNKKLTVSLPRKELIQRGYCRLRVTKDFMQTAVNAFAILQNGNLKDVMALPAEYVLRSARTIAMMKLPREKLMATWEIVKGDKKTNEITITTLELFRPLFKYVPGREMARLNLTNDRILSYIGTHAELDRHQVGLIANKYIEINPKWTQSRYLNLLNNILCGIPMTFMRKINKNNYLQLSYQTFYHIHACDPLQRRFFLNMMANTQTLGKSASWTALDVSRLGFLLIEVEGPVLATVNPPAMAGITAQVMRLMPVVTLKCITEMQLRYIEQKPLNILAKKLKNYQELKYEFSNAHRHVSFCLYFIVNIIIKIIYE